MVEPSERVSAGTWTTTAVSPTFQVQKGQLPGNGIVVSLNARLLPHSTSVLVMRLSPSSTSIDLRIYGYSQSVVRFKLDHVDEPDIWLQNGTYPSTRTPAPAPERICPQ